MQRLHVVWVRVFGSMTPPEVHHNAGSMVCWHYSVICMRD